MWCTARSTWMWPVGIFDVGEGESFVVDGGVEHQAWALEESEVLDVFTPMRDEYKALVA